MAELEFNRPGCIWKRENTGFRSEKQRRFADGNVLDAELFPCWYCSLYYDKVGWLKDAPDHDWSPHVRALRQDRER